MEKIVEKILTDLKVELADKFDKNFSQGGFFGNKWKPKKDDSASHLIKTGALRRSVKSHLEGGTIVFTSSTPYATIHNEGLQGNVSIRSHSRRGRNGKQQTVKAHTRKINMPKRQFIGEYPGWEKTAERTAKRVIEQEIKDLIQKTNKN